MGLGFFHLPGTGAAVGFGCDRINPVSTQQLQSFSTLLGFPVIGFVDAIRELLEVYHWIARPQS